MVHPDKLVRQLIISQALSDKSLYLIQVGIRTWTTWRNDADNHLAPASILPTSYHWHQGYQYGHAVPVPLPQENSFRRHY